jgi:hypothetical protein
MTHPAPSEAALQNLQGLPNRRCLAILSAVEQTLGPAPQALLDASPALDHVHPATRPLVPVLAALLETARWVAEVAAENGRAENSDADLFASDLTRLRNALRIAGLAPAPRWWPRPQALVCADKINSIKHPDGTSEVYRSLPESCPPS